MSRSNSLLGVSFRHLVYSAVACLLAAVVVAPLPAPAQQASAEPADLHVELRSATGSNVFQVGEVIPLELVLSSPTPGKYLQPCALFRESHFGYPVCRFENQASFTVTPETAVVEYRKAAWLFEIETGGGPLFQVPVSYLTAEPTTFSKVLTHDFRFDAPGDYRVRISLTVGFDDEATKPVAGQDTKPHAISITREITLRIVPPRREWQEEILRKGVEASSTFDRGVHDPKSAETAQYTRDIDALCYLGTGDAARALAKLLLTGHRVDRCLSRSPSVGAGVVEMQRLLVLPETAINPDFFNSLMMLTMVNDARIHVTQPQQRAAFRSQQLIIDEVRNALIAALPKKTGDAHIPSLVTVLQNPNKSPRTPYTDGAELPFSREVLADAAANFERLPYASRTWLLEHGWDRLQSPIMLPAVRQRAMASDGPALLRWLELDPKGATAFIRQEIVNPWPRFSSFYLRLPDASLPKQEHQIAKNFVSLTGEFQLSRSASLLHRYATRAVLPEVLPFIDANRSKWACSVQLPALAYVLKVSPGDAEPRIEQALRDLNQGTCNSYSFLGDLGFLEQNRILEKMALAEIDAGRNMARDGAEYLQHYGSPAMKPLVWDRLVRAYAGAGTEQKRDPARSEQQRALTDAYAQAQGWVLSQEDEQRLRALIGKRDFEEIACRFGCGESPSVVPQSEPFAINAGTDGGSSSRGSELSFLDPPERLRYGIKQYGCASLKQLGAKLLQFPAGSTFIFSYRFSSRDQDEITKIADFLLSHGYKVKNPQQWTFLPTD